jgi:hypothetical protein
MRLLAMTSTRAIDRGSPACSTCSNNKRGCSASAKASVLPTSSILIGWDSLAGLVTSAFHPFPPLPGSRMMHRSVNRAPINDRLRNSLAHSGLSARPYPTRPLEERVSVWLSLRCKRPEQAPENMLLGRSLAETTRHTLAAAHFHLPQLLD